MNTVLLIAAFAAMFIYEFSLLKKEKLWRELAAFLAFFAFAFTIGLLQAMGVELPNPLEGIRYLIERFLDLSSERVLFPGSS